MEVTNTLAYYGTEFITVVKRFTGQVPGPNVIKLFMALIYECS
jgi:hypothetical protein